MSGKTPVSWNGLVKAMKADTPKLHLSEVLKTAGKEWKKVKAGTHPKYTQGKSEPVIRKKTSTDTVPKPGHKGAPSITRPGKIDYVTHKGDKFYHRDGKLEEENVDGVKGKPYSHHKTRKHKNKDKGKGKSTHSRKKTCKNCKKNEKIIKELQGVIAELKK